MNSIHLKYVFIGSTIALAFSACKVTQTYQRPDASGTGLYRGVTTADTTSIANLHWNQVFTDTYLQQLITEGIANNLNLKIAYSRIQAAKAYYLQSGAALQPTLAAQAGVGLLSSLQGSALNGDAQLQAGFSSTWEADIWGRLSSARKGALASLLQSEAYTRAVQTGLIANIANYYYTLLALDRQLAITEQTVQNRIKTVETIRALKEAGTLTGAAVVQSEASRYAAEVTLPDLKQDIRETENALSILLGHAPGAIARNTIDNQATAMALSTGVPAQLLSNRPDVQQAEYNYRYYFEQTNVARAYFYPALTITGVAGLTNLSLSSFFNSGILAGNITGGLTAPIFNKRLNKTRLEVAKAQQQEALLNFQSSLLTAGQEVSDALSSYQTSADKKTVRTNQLASLQKSVEFTQELLKYGSANYTEVLTAQQSLLDAQLNSVNDKLQELRAVVALYRSLGGGWK